MQRERQFTCLDRSQLKSYLSEQIQESEELSIQEHLEHCSHCQKQLEQVAAERAMWDEFQEISLEVGATRKPDGQIEGLLEQLAPTEDPRFLGRLGAYEVCAVIGQGSTGIVLKALESRLNRYVAIKVLTPALASSGPARRRFEREGRAIAAVSHQHVVPIYAVDEHRGLPYIVMQYIPGVSLLQRIEKSGSLTSCEVVRIGLQVASGLAAAHGQGIVHRDVKPANVILEDTVDRAMVTDFGLALVLHEATMTRSGTISGTPQYMSPEQAQGESVDPKTDLFSLGSLLYAASTARAPFRAETVFGIIHRVCQTEPRPIREVNPEIDPWLAQFIQKLMSKAPEQRFASARQVAELLEEELAYLQNPSSAPEPGRTWMLEPPLVESRKEHSQPKQSMLKANPAIIVAATTSLMTLVLAGFMAWKEFGTSSRPELVGQSPTDSQGETADSASVPDQIERIQPALSDPAMLQNDMRSEPDAGALSERAAKSVLEESPDHAERPKAVGREIDSFALLAPEDSPEESWVTSDEGTEALTRNFTQRIERSFDVPLGSKIVLEVAGGNIEVRQTELDYAGFVALRTIEAGSQAEAEKIASFQRIDVNDEGGVIIQAVMDAAFVDRGGEASFQRMVFGLAVPVGIDVEVKTSHGNVTVDPMTANVTAHARSGDIRFERMQGNLIARVEGGELVSQQGCTGNVDFMATHGNVCVAGIEKVARLRASDGNIYVGANQGEVSAHATGGDVRISNVSSPTSAHVEVGNAFLRLTESPKSSCKVSVANGDLNVSMIDSIAANLRTTGRLDTELAFTPEASSEEGAQGQANEWQAAELNGGGEWVQLSASSGIVRITMDAEASTRSSLGGSGNEYFSLGGSGNHNARQAASQAAIEKTTGDPRPGAMVPIAIENGGNIDGYTLYLPVSHAASDGPYPIILYMQGGYGVGGEITRINDWGLPRLVRDENDLSLKRNELLLDRFIIVCPHIQEGQYHDHPDVITRILDEVVERYRGDLSRVYLTGLSRGGHASWDMVAKLPTTFAATVPIGGQPSVEDYSVFDSVPTWVSHNLGDPTVAWSLSDEAVKQIEGATASDFKRFDVPVPDSTEIAQAKYIFTEPNIDRHDAWTDLYSSDVLYTWLLQQQRSEAEAATSTVEPARTDGL